MNIIGKKFLDKYVKRNIQLKNKVAEFVDIVKLSDWKSSIDVKNTFKDVDKV